MTVALSSAAAIGIFHVTCHGTLCRDIKSNVYLLYYVYGHNGRKDGIFSAIDLNKVSVMYNASLYHSNTSSEL